MKLFSGRSPVIDKMKNRCLQHRCIKCCLNTEMPLSNSDIARIKGLGFKDFFITKRNGTRQLKNFMGRCVFHNGQRCTIYSDRPEGCRLYPAIFDADKEKIILDEHCPHPEKFQSTQRISWQVIKLVQKLDAERKRSTRSAGQAQEG